MTDENKLPQCYLYMWTHLPTGKWYVGSRTAKNARPDDVYLCSSLVVKPKIQANPEQWQRKILCLGSKEYIRDLESRYLAYYDAKNHDQSFNAANTVRHRVKSSYWNWEYL